GVTVVITLAVLSPVVASVMPEGAVTVAVSVNVPVVVAVPWIVTVQLDPLAPLYVPFRVPPVEVAVQVVPVPAALTS
ncbi:hypothetical protein, partial [Deinococcus sp. GbtcB9]|uniref:hypothetical protein n=1 Tax=Deinococcus sp. GbtcB9 TaxID=2824754 RepID=UPI001C2FB612